MRSLPDLFAGPGAYADAAQLAATFKALADPARLQLLAILDRNGESTVLELTDVLGRLSQPTVSHHLNVLVAAGLVLRRRDGRFVPHRINERGLSRVADALRPGGGDGDA